MGSESIAHEAEGLVMIIMLNGATASFLVSLLRLF